MPCKRCGADVDPQERGGIFSYECGACGYQFVKFLTPEADRAGREVLATLVEEHPEVQVQVVKPPRGQGFG